MRILIDVNIPKEVCEELRKLGFDAIYLTEVLPENAEDQKILRWIENHNALILTKDKRFPETEGGRRAVLASQSPSKLSREALRKLTVLGAFPI